MKFWMLLLAHFIPVLAFGIGADYRTLSPEIFFPEQIGFARRDESSSSTLNALSTAQTFVKLTATVTTINGAVAPASPVARMLVISNYTGSSVTISHESSSATAANRFFLTGAADFILTNNASTTFLYDHGQSRWIPTSGGGAVAAHDLAVGTGLDISSGTGTGATLKDLTISIASGFYLPSTSDQTTWDQAATDATQALTNAATAQAAADAAQAAIDAHIADTSAAHAASAISNTPSGNVSSTDVQAAINELQTEIDGLIGLTDLSGTAPISYDNTTGVFSMLSATGSRDGYLSSTKFADFQGAVNDTGNATDADTPGQLVRRDGAGDFAAHDITGHKFIGPLNGNADTASAFASDPADCTLPQVAIGVHADGSANCVNLNSTHIGFTPTTGGDWTTSPTTVQEALDELGARSSGGGGSIGKAAQVNCGVGIADSHTIALLNYDQSTVIDYAPIPSTWTIPTGSSGGGTPKFGAGSGSCGNASVARTTTSHAIGSGSWTMDIQFKASNAANSQGWSETGTSTGQFDWHYDNGHNIIFRMAGTTIVTAPYTMPDTNYHHYAVIDVAGTVHVTADGADLGSGSDGGRNLTATGQLDICTAAGIGGQGNIDEVRFSDIARWTTFPFTPPTIEYPITNTIVSDPDSLVSSVTGGGTVGQCRVNSSDILTTSRCFCNTLTTNSAGGNCTPSGAATSGGQDVHTFIAGSAANALINFQCF